MPKCVRCGYENCKCDVDDGCLCCPKHCFSKKQIDYFDSVPKATVMEIFDLAEAIEKTKYLSRQHKELVTRYYTLKDEICGVKAEE
jgi:hypothetical protein